MVVVVGESGRMDVPVELTTRERRKVLAGIDAGPVQGERVEGSEHSDVRKDRHIVLAVAVTVR